MTSDFLSTRDPGQSILRAGELKQRRLNGVPCRPPCWEGITPGKTSAVEAANILSASALFSRVEIRSSSLRGVKTGHVNFEGRVSFDDGAVRSWGGDALFDRSTPEQIIYVIRVRFPDIYLGELIQAYGEPSHVMAYGSPAPDIGGPYTWQLDLLWVSAGLAMRTGGAVEPQINQELSLGSSLYFPPTIEGYGRATSPFYQKYVKPWQGYADFDMYFEPTSVPEGKP